MKWIKADWPAPANVHALTTLRSGGYSQGAFDSFNLAAHVGDDDHHVSHNRQLLKDILALPAEPLWLNQIHSHQVVSADQQTSAVQADAAFSNLPGKVCVVMTADCLPLLVTTADGQSIAAIHAGWRGLLAGVIEHTLAAMPAGDKLVWLGPAIGPKQFQVGDDVRQAFVEKNPQWASAFQRQKEGKWLMDIYSAARQILHEKGIQRVFGGRFCTVNESDSFFSYRRDGKTGRMASLIWRE